MGISWNGKDDQSNPGKLKSPIRIILSSVDQEYCRRDSCMKFVSRSSEIRYSLLIDGLYISRNRIPSNTIEQPQSNWDINVVDLLGSQPNAAVPPCFPKHLSERQIWVGVLLGKTTELVWLSNYVSVTNR